MKNKKYCVQIFQVEPECDEFIIEAKHINDAKTKASKVLRSDYFGWKIENIEELK